MSGDDSPLQKGLVRKGEHDVVPLKAILRSLKIMANNIRNESRLDEIKKQLKSCNYNHWLGDNPDERQMMKALAVAVNEAIQEKKIEPRNKYSKVNEELNDLLARGYENYSSPDTYFYKRKNLSKDLKITSPCVFAEECLTCEAKDAQWVVASIIQRQFDIKWDTPTGEPADYSFYDFCITKKTKEFFKYIPRLAHVKTALYKECRSKQQMLDDLLQMPKSSLCPDVFLKAVGDCTTWMTLQAPDKKDKEGQFTPLPKDWFLSEEFSWIDDNIRHFIEEDADKQKNDHESLKQSLKNPTLYWAVIEDKDFPPIQNDKNLKLNSIGSTQVYVGKANKGINGRWLEDSDSHCKMIKKCLDNVGAMTTYDPMRLEGIQLVDARLALAKVRKEKTALFVMKTFGDDLEKAQIAELEAKASLRVAEESLQSQSSQRTENALSTESAQTDDDISSKLESLKADVEERQQELDEASEEVLKLRRKGKCKMRADGKVQLKKEENLHLKGYRAEKPCKINIISSQELRMKWEPTNMAYGMNSRK